MTKFAVIENTPGYLPDDDDPPVFDELEQAVAALRERAQEYADDESGDYAVTVSGDGTSAEVTDRSKTYDLGRVIEVIPQEEESE